MLCERRARFSTYKVEFGKQHPIIGFVVLGGMVVQPVLGWVHHVMFLSTRRPTWVGTVHVWLGRLTMMLGIINGGLGLSDADNAWPSEIAYIVLAGVSFTVYLLLLGLVAYRDRIESSETAERKDEEQERGELARAVIE